MGAVSCKQSLWGDPVKIKVSIGDVKSAGTYNKVIIKFSDADGKESKELILGDRCHLLQKDFKAGSTRKFVFPDLESDISEITTMEIWREGWLNEALLLNTVIVKRVNTGARYVFPVNRWIPKNERLRIRPFDSFLPFEDPDPERRREELDLKQQQLDLTVKASGLPVQCSALPEEYTFSSNYQWDLGARKAKLFIKSKMELMCHVSAVSPVCLPCGAKLRLEIVSNWTKLEDMKNMYKILPLPLPARENWHLKDECFGEQRLAGCNPMQIKLCTTIPPNFAVTSEMVEPSLDGQTLAGALENKRLFLVDYKILEDLKTASAKLHLPAPLGLFFRSDSGKLLPVAIQLEQAPSDTNPVFLPSDPPYTWMMAKMWFNLADASIHQACVHLGFTHLIAESFCVVTHRQLSPSHPIFRLLAPHFLFLLAINNLALSKLVRPGGWIDKTMTMGKAGTFDIIRRTLTTWRLDVQGTLPENIKSRGVTPDVLPHYPYRDDAMPIYNIIKDYVKTVVEGHYKDSKERLLKDNELQAWADELTKPFSEDGAGLQGVPGEGKLETSEDLVQILTSVIFISSAQHAAANFNQYDQYGFPAVYPARLKGKPPSSKDPLNEEDILDALPDMQLTLEIMLVTQILSERGTNALGNFEVQYGYDDIAQSALAKFKEDLNKARKDFLARNRKRDYSYTVLNPAEIPNAISI